MLPVAGLGDDAGSVVTTVTSMSNAISVPLSSTATTAEPTLSATSVVLSSKNGSANGKYGHACYYSTTFCVNEMQALISGIYVPSSSLRMSVTVSVLNVAGPLDTDAVKVMVSESSAMESSDISRLNDWSSFPKVV